MDRKTMRAQSRPGRSNPVRLLCADLAIADSLTFRDVSDLIQQLSGSTMLRGTRRVFPGVSISCLFRIYFVDNLFRQSPDDSFSGSSSSDFLAAGLGLAIFAGMSKA